MKTCTAIGPYIHRVILKKKKLFFFEAQEQVNSFVVLVKKRATLKMHFSTTRSLTQGQLSIPRS